MHALLRRPAVVTALCWVLGYVVVAYVEIPRTWSSLTIMMMLLIMIGIVWGLRLPGRQWISYFFLIGLAASYYHWVDSNNVSGLTMNSTSEHRVEQTVTVKGTIASSVTVDGDRVSFILDVQHIQWTHEARQIHRNTGMDGESTLLEDERTDLIQLKEKMQVSLRLLREEEVEQVSQWQRGDDLILGEATIQQPSTASNFGGFDYSKYLERQRIHWLIQVKGTEWIQIETRPIQPKLKLLRWTDRFRTALGAIVDRVYPTRQSGFMKSLLIGLRDDMDPTSYQQFAKLGLSHILAISGLHVGIFIASILQLMRWLGRPKETALLVALCIVPAYIILTGASPSVIRAGCMAMIALYAARRNKLKDGLTVVSVVGLFMLIVEPYYLYNVSFQFSFIVTIGLIIFVPLTSRMLPIKNKVINSAVAVSVVAEWVSFPLSIYYFNQYSLLSLPANLFIIPVISMIVIPLGSVSMIAALLHVDFGAWIGWPAQQVNHLVFRIVETMNGWHLFHLIWPSLSMIWILLYYSAVGWICHSLVKWKFARENSVQLGHDHNLTDEGSNVEQPIVYESPTSLGRQGRPGPVRWYGLVLSCCIFLVLLVYGYDPDRWSREGRVYFIDVGQGDAIYIRTPNNKHVLIDGGGTITFSKPGDEWKERREPYEVGAKLLVPLLKKRGVQQLDMVILTHADADHYGGLQAVVEQIPVKQFWFNGTYKKNDTLYTLFNTILQRNIPVHIATSGSIIELDPYTTLEMHYPLTENRQQVVIENNQNDESVVLTLHMYASSFLFAGDLEKAGEFMLVSQMQSEAYRSIIPPIDVLKVGHHGSKTSTTSEWLAYWQPEQAVISAGRNNVYGHPHPDVVDRLQQFGIEVYRTDQHGEILYTVNPEAMDKQTKWSVFGERPRSGSFQDLDEQ